MKAASCSASRSRRRRGDGVLLAATPAVFGTRAIAAFAILDPDGIRRTQFAAVTDLVAGALIGERLARLAKLAAQREHELNDLDRQIS
jgi:hypothetical protein